MSIKENLQKILKGVYGKDVRQAIHDSIEQCETDMESGIQECKATVDEVYRNVIPLWDLLSETVNVALLNGRIWAYGGGLLNTNPVSGYEVQCAYAHVSQGEIYKVTTYRDAESYAIVPIFCAADGTAEGEDAKLVKAINEPSLEGANDYFVTVPEGADMLLISSNNRSKGDITVRKLK